MSTRTATITVMIAAFALSGTCVAQTWQTIYQNNFSSDPGWITNSPTHYFCDPSDGTFFIDQENINYGGGFACYDVGSAGGSFRLSYDIKMVRGDYATGVSFGMYDSDFNAEDYGSFVQVAFVTDDRGRNVLMNSRNADDAFSYDWYAGVPWVLDRWYSVSMEYNENTGSFACTVRDRDTGALVGTKSATVGPFSPDMSYIGSSSVRAWTYQRPGAHSMAKIDNVAFSMANTTSLITASLDVDPDTLNLGSDSKWITCYVTLPDSYDVADVDPTSVLLNEQIAPAWTMIDEEEQVLKVKFDRAAIQELLVPGEVELMVTGLLTGDILFEGFDTIRVVDPGRG